MKHYKIILLNFLVLLAFSCSENADRTKVFDNKEVKLDSVIQAKPDKNSIPIKNKWKLLKINRPWDMEPSVPLEREIWDFLQGDSLIVQTHRGNSFSFQTEWKYTFSAFSNDSTWVMSRLKNQNSQTIDFEINLSNDTLVLIEQCDDCYSFEFKKLVSKKHVQK